MITLKLIIYSFILFILLIKFSSCENNIIDLINIILIITLFNLILEKFMNTNIKEDYDPISNNNYSSLDTNIINNSYSNEEIKEDKIKKKEESKDEESKDEESKDEESKEEESKEEESKEIKNNIEEISNTTNKIVNVIKDNVKNIINNNIIKSDKEREDPKLDNKFIYGYSYLHTDNWSIPEKRQPVCKNINPCKICPNKTDGFNAHLLNYSNISNGK